jgi:hypothetical protein
VKIFTQHEPLTDVELDRLGKFLRNCEGGRAMNIEQLDGFFAALIAGPETVMPSEYYREVFGGEMSDACGRHRPYLREPESERVLFGAFVDVKVAELANLGLRQNPRHDFRLFGARVDHYKSVERVDCKVTSDFFAVAMLSVGKSSIHPVQVVI